MNRNEDSIYRLPAEWTQGTAILLAWPHCDTDWSYILPETVDCYRNIVTAISAYHDVVIVTPYPDVCRRQLPQEAIKRVTIIPLTTNDTWARDFGPLTVVDDRGDCRCLDFRFNGWGLKFAACYDNLINRGLESIGTITAPLINCQDFVLEGGGIESDGNGTLMTTSQCQLSPNRNPVLSKSEIQQRLIQYFGAKSVIWLDHGYLAGDDTDSHIDTLARFAPDNSIVYVGCQNPEDEHFEELSLMKQQLAEATDCQGNPFNLFELPMPGPIYDEEGERLPATYANFLATNRAVFMPSYGQPANDDLAKRILEVAFSRPVVTVDCRTLIRQHGSLHCITMQIPIQALCLENK